MKYLFGVYLHLYNTKNDYTVDVTLDVHDGGDHHHHHDHMPEEICYYSPSNFLSFINTTESATENERYWLASLQTALITLLLLLFRFLSHIRTIFTAKWLMICL